MLTSIANIFRNHGHSTHFLATRELLIIFGTYFIYSMSKNIIDPTPILQAFSNAWQLVALQEKLGLAHEATIQVWATSFSMGFMAFLAYLYAIGLWVALMGSAVLLFIFKRNIYWRLRSVFLITMFTAVAIFALYPLAPPRMLPDYGMADVVVMLGLNPVEKSDSMFNYNKFAAMPSLHIAWSLLVTVAWFKVGWKPAKVLSSLYLALMTLAVVATANHYILDVFAGAALLVFAIWAVDLPMRLRMMFEGREMREFVPAFSMGFPESGYHGGYHNSAPAGYDQTPAGPAESTHWGSLR